MYLYLSKSASFGSVCVVKKIKKIIKKIKIKIKIKKKKKKKK